MSALEKLRGIHAKGPVKSINHHPLSSFNKWLAVSITTAVGSMWCAYLFALWAVVGFPGLLPAWVNQYVQWVSQTFVQLVLLSIIMVGQSVLNLAADARAEQDHEILGHTIDILDGQNRELATQTEILKLLQAALIKDVSNARSVKSRSS
jgi:hypothetical protein